MGAKLLTGQSYYSILTEIGVTVLNSRHDDVNINIRHH